MHAVLIILAINLALVSTLTAPMSVGSNQQLISGGTVVIDTSSSYGNTTIVWNPMNYTVSFPSTMVSAYNVKMAVALK